MEYSKYPRVRNGLSTKDRFIKTDNEPGNNTRYDKVSENTAFKNGTVLDIEGSVDKAMVLYANGDLNDAYKIINHVLAIEPEQPRALYLMGTILLCIGRYDAAISCLEKAQKRINSNPGLRLSLGTAYRRIGRLNDAVDVFKQAISETPNFADLHVNLGNTFVDLNCIGEAAGAYQTAISIDNRSFLAHYNLALVYKKQNKLEDALSEIETSLQISPEYTPSLNELGLIYISLDRLEDARTTLEKAVSISPNDPQYHNNLADVLKKLEDYDGAIAESQIAVNLEPGFAEAHVNLGLCYTEKNDMQSAVNHYEIALNIDPSLTEARYNYARCLRRLGKYENAVSQLEQTISQKPDFVEAYNALGSVYHEILETEKAYSCYQKAIDLDNNHAYAHWNLSLLQLLTGNYNSGFEGLDWRFKIADPKWKPAQCYQWKGESLAGKRILILAEQGFGDTINFIRFISHLENEASYIRCACQPSLAELLRHTPYHCDFVEYNTDGSVDDTGFDYYAWMMSLPSLLKLNEATLCGDVPYLDVSRYSQSELSLYIKETLSSLNKKMNIGVVWAGSRKMNNNHIRSMSFSDFKPFFELDDIAFVSLQQGEPVTQINQDHDNFVVLEPYIRTFVETAVMIQELDLIITVDTAVAHVAGAMGKPVWTLLHYSPDWRWRLGTEHPYWYPTMRLFRQKEPLKWEQVISEVKLALQKELLEMPQE